jgi:NAD-dependent deacetylase
VRRLVVLSGAGISAESGIPTFRGADGLWEGHDVTAVASPEGWEQDPELVLNFYNERRKAIRKAKPNRGHQILAELQDNFDVDIITQNIDDLHERAGSRNVLHLHGQINQSRSTENPSLIYTIDGEELNIGDCCELGSQLRPNVVWFGEMVPAMERAMELTLRADIFVVVGTSLLVYPAAGLLEYAPYDAPKFIVDPNAPDIRRVNGIQVIQEPASIGLEKVREMLRDL